MPSFNAKDLLEIIRKFKDHYAGDSTIILDEIAAQVVSGAKLTYQ